MNAKTGGIWAVVPVKPFGLAKQRLASAFTPIFRQELVRAMLCDVLAALREARGLAGFAVITADPQAGRLARDRGGRWLIESEVRGLNPAASEAAARFGAEGAAGLLVLPGDLPAVTAGEIDALISSHGSGRAASLIASQDGDGTNALLLSPPQAMGFAFGPGSFARHQAGAEALGIVPQVHESARFPGFARDIDTPDEVRRLTDLRPGSHTARLLASGHCS
ncbi:2-phospho-L-lactate guanylyltransferase [Ancylobacter rudongensis]|uniref:3-phospho-D-glycerate guanylyltransferase n=1 Tax=Ancylobacter rudongensis TaxID=177413 RepID=A0A1G4RDM9_9HYPH|nr:2-phospho-L-lactate guanylyltransferase [Ancylobacter rudongensis]SCW54994.1 2-phospho-L-lactate guanylyltransferase [Ancylobacter rudongensis]